jgi:hypothetical protein
MNTWPDFQLPPINLWTVPYQRFVDENPKAPPHYPRHVPGPILDIIRRLARAAK